MSITWSDLKGLVGKVSAEAERQRKDKELARKAAWTMVHLLHRQEVIKINFKA